MNSSTSLRSPRLVVSGCLTFLVICLLWGLLVPLIHINASTLEFSKSLSFGSKSDSVSELQTVLTATGDYAYTSVTGYFGQYTLEAVKRYQAREGIIDSGTPETTGFGVVGPKTIASLQQKRIALATIPYVNTSSVATASSGVACTLGNGTPVPENQSYRFYRLSSIPATWKQSCDVYSRIRTCRGGVFDNNLPDKATGQFFDKLTCVITGGSATSSVPLVSSSASTTGSCKLTNGDFLKNKESLKFYRKSQIPATWKQSCDVYSRIRTCRDGVIDRSEPYKITGEVYDKVSCQVVGAIGRTINPNIIGNKEQWKLTYADEFSSTTPDWEYQDGPNYLGGYRLAEQARVNGGFLRIYNEIGSRPAYPTSTRYSTTSEGNTRVIKPVKWESAHMWSKKEFRYGFFEARIKISKAQSIDNAFWLMAYPIGSEIDIVEALYWRDTAAKYASDMVSVSVHGRKFGTSVALKHKTKALFIKKDLSEDFHTYAVDWQRDKITFYLDGEMTYEIVDRSVLEHFDTQPLRMRLSTAIADIFSKEGVLTSEAHGTYMAVDYVRVFERVK